MSRIVFATFGSLGDLHPVIAMAVEMRRRGHRIEIATNETYREKLSALGLPFHALRPDLFAAGEHVISRIMEGHGGTVRLMRDEMFPAVRDMYADLLPVVAGADLLVASELVYAAPLLAEKHGVRWVGFSFAPVSLFSECDPPLLPLPRGLRWLQRLGPWLPRNLKRIARCLSRSWCRPVREFRGELGLPEGGHPLFEGKFSPELYLALFSPVLQAPQADWPPQTVQTGFCFFDEVGAGALPPAVANFLSAGEAPIVFTLGSAAVYVAGEFYAESSRAAQLLGRRALLLLGKNPPPPDLPPSVLGWDYLPYEQIFPRAAAVVHQGGVGTTAQALRAGRPMLVVPFAHDQFDNAERVVRLGAGRTLSRSRYRAPAVASELQALLSQAHFAETSREVAQKIRRENGVARAADALERRLGAQAR